MFECVFHVYNLLLWRSVKIQTEIDVIDLKNESVVVGTDIKRRNKATEKGEEKSKGGRKEGRILRLVLPSGQ